MVQLPDGVELTLSELQDMASQQQQQIESQQQILVAKEQRLKFLKQQELRHQQMASDNERLRRLKEKAEAQELKLRKLRAQRGQVEQQKMNNTSLTSELESTRALFNEKEKELSVAAAKVEELSKQLEELRRGRLSNQVIAGQSSPAAIELEKLRRELLYRNKLNEQQNNKLAQQREALNRGQEEMNRIDRRIAELQQRLHRKRLLNQQLANQINAAASAKQAQLRASNTRSRVRPLSANIAAVEPFKHTPRESQPVTPTIQPERSQDDLHPKLIVAKTEDLPEFQPNKNDPKYQTLPVNTKFSVKFNKNEAQQNEDVKNGNKSNEVQHATKKPDEKQGVIPTTSPSSNGQKPSTQTVHSIPAYLPPKGHATGIPQQNISQAAAPPPPPPQPKQSLSNLAPKPFGSTYSSSLLSSTGPLASRSQPAVTVTPSTIGPVGSPPLPVPKYIPPPAPPANSTMQPPIYRPQTNLPTTPLTASATEKPTSSVPPTSMQQVKPSPPMGAPGAQNRPSTIYQTSSTRVTPITPHTFSTTPRGLLQEVEDSASPQTTSEVPSSGVSSMITTTPAMTKFAITASVPVNARGSATEVYNGENSHNNSSVTSNKQVEGSEMSGGRNVSDVLGSPTKPSLPPKPSIPQKPTPPPRQIHANGDKTKVDTSQDAVDSALTILKSSAATKGNGSYRYAPRNVITDTYTQKLGSGALNQYLRNVTQLQLYGKADDDVNSVQQIQNSEISQNTGAGSDEAESEVNNKKVSQNDLPIKPKPLTIKKQSGVEPPKLKVLSNGNAIPNSPRKQSPPLENSSAASNNNGNNGNTQNGNNRNNINVHISINRRIEMPPAFHFPENQSPPPDLNNTLNNGPTNELGTDVTDNVVNIPPPPSHAPPPYPPLDVDNKNWDPTKARLDKSKRRPVTEIGVNDSAVLDNYSSNQPIDGEGNVEAVTSFSPETEQTEEQSESNNSEVVIVNHQEQLTGTEDTSLTNNSDSNVDNQTVVETSGMVRRICKGNLKTKGSTKSVRRVSFDPLALLLDASLEGELELVKKTANEVPNPSAANDEGITALHNAICAGHYEIVKFLVEFGCDVNAQDSDGWTPLHCAASCNNLPMVKFLVEHGACIFATTLSDCETAAQKCEEDEEGFDGCSEYLYSVQEKLGILNNGAVYALYDYEAQNTDELSFKDGEMIIVLRKGDEFEREWWWSQFKNREGYVPRNLLGLYPRVVPKKEQ